jgi:hypothetical protein
MVCRERFAIHSPLEIDAARKRLRRQVATLSGQLLGEFDGEHLLAVVDLSIAPLVEIDAKLREWPTKSRATLRGEIRLSPPGVVLCGLFVAGSLLTSSVAVTRGAPLLVVPLFVTAALLGLASVWHANARRARELLERTLRASATIPRARRLIRQRAPAIAAEPELEPIPILCLRDPYRGRAFRHPVLPTTTGWSALLRAALTSRRR